MMASSSRPKLGVGSSSHGTFLKDLSLGDKCRGTVSTGVTIGNTSEEQLVVGQGISVSTKTHIQATTQNVDPEERYGRYSHEKH